MSESIVSPDVRTIIHSLQAYLISNRETYNQCNLLKEKNESIQYYVTSAYTPNKRVTGDVQAIISMELVRIALRRNDHGDSAAKTDLKQYSVTKKK